MVLILITSSFSVICYIYFVQIRVPSFTPYGLAPAYNFVNITNYQQYHGEIKTSLLIIYNLICSN